MDDAVSGREAVALGARGGALVAVSGTVGYVGLPLLTREYAGALDAAFVMTGAVVDLPRAGVVLVLPSALATVCCVLAARRRGPPTAWTDAGVVFVPVAGAVACYLLTGVWVAGDALASGGLSADPAWAAVEVVSVAGAVFAWGALFTLVVLAVVVAGVGVGAGAGYLLARGVLRVRRPSPTADRPEG